MSFSNNTIKSEELQEFLVENLENLAKRVEQKNKFREKLKGVLPDNQYKNFCDCGGFLQVNEQKEIIRGNFCKNRFCSVCNRKYASQKWHKIKAITEEITQILNPTYALLTLTVKNVKASELSAEIDRLMKSIDRLHKTTHWQETVLGFFRSLEITFNEKEQTYHPHYHYILVLPSAYKERMKSTYEWRKLWERSARLEYNSQIDIQIIADEEKLSGGIAEVAKYAVKMSTVIDSGKSALKPLTRAIKGRRLISYGGIIKELAKSYERRTKSELRERDKTPTEAYIFRDNRYEKYY